MVFYCEQAAGFSNDIGLQDEGYFNAIVHMFRQALRAIGTLPEPQRRLLWDRLDTVRRLGHNCGYGVGDDMDALLGEFGVNG